MFCPQGKHRKWSYRDLPLRYADFGRLHRFELSGSCSGLTRVRSFCQDDSHIFLATNQIEAEVKRQLDVFLACYKFFGFKKVKIYLSTRPEKRMEGEESVWDEAESALKRAGELALTSLIRVLYSLSDALLLPLSISSELKFLFSKFESISSGDFPKSIPRSLTNSNFWFEFIFA